MLWSANLNSLECASANLINYRHLRPLFLYTTMHLKFILFVAALALAASAKPFPRIKRDVTNCGTSNDPLTLDSLTMTPNPPQKGQNLTVIAAGTLNQPILNNSTINVSVMYGLYSVLFWESPIICSYSSFIILGISCELS